MPSRLVVLHPSRSAFYFTTADGMLGLFGFTSIVRRDGEITKSISSTVAPRREAPFRRAQAHR